MEHLSNLQGCVSEGRGKCVAETDTSLVAGTVRLLSLSPACHSGDP